MSFIIDDDQNMPNIRIIIKNNVEIMQGKVIFIFNFEFYFVQYFLVPQIILQTFDKFGFVLD